MISTAQLFKQENRILDECARLLLLMHQDFVDAILQQEFRELHAFLAQRPIQLNESEDQHERDKSMS